MSNILDIPQIPEFHLDVLQRDLHIGHSLQSKASQGPSARA